MKNFVVTASTKGIGWSVAKSLFEKYPDSKVFISYSHDEIADAYIFILENSYMNGEVLPINGGYNYF
ncbi:hypothetical protein [Bacteroides thetaiotaomicron]|mgnify:CR=1 FL=1|uniref:SDR family NAD(P)-dependent oxidoreductase n=1 Tax=Bacteroides thetaiotaomicron TaxID=818 RepID=A0AAW4ZFS0_BACT4|nr:hypothetical protein [Bacteroides thetaiotaomicron]MCE9240483.1 hypothetical protein [Bacteroides thetaiotaomicron]MCE9269671.1 hypothetical protein [Bacteroides thetaiotaomicron]MCE9279241.1 hypothetical protein [Bacteroides thetaiotaomicron]MCE9293501.1 hypothetical protein [Bacteroides thetaiotaomicron]